MINKKYYYSPILPTQLHFILQRPPQKNFQPKDQSLIMQALKKIIHQKNFISALYFKKVSTKFFKKFYYKKVELVRRENPSAFDVDCQQRFAQSLLLRK
eukprot:TRINITY_DN354_c0_g1_i2.p1 TRINITY_DN354_c0_g1~~TRINITY_DN354_c0_g1_i2.p1  ORF type:complete len:108 (+),score=4.05 TRINITY_DN354_c0_g1_i2:29-325(+)